MTIDDFLDRLEGVKRSGGEYQAVCPAHEDRSPSLGVREGDEGILVHCHAGCTTESIVEALGLSLRDLYYEPRSSRDDEPEAIYSYVDEKGEELFQAVRFPGKNFRQRHMDENGQWVWNLQGVRRVLYQLPAVLEAKEKEETIFIVEGEKDVRAMGGLGVLATCNPMGAGKWRDEYSEALRGAYVVIIQDRDEPGRAHAKQVKESIERHGGHVIAIRQPKVGKDASDHIAAGLGLTDFVTSKAPLEHGVYTSAALAEAARDRLHLKEEDLPSWDPLKKLAGGGHLAFRNGRLYITGGYTGDGKTALALQCARGLCEEGARVGYFSLEMTPEDLVNRLLEHIGLPLKALEAPWTIPGSPHAKLYKEGVEQLESWGLDIIFKPGGINSEYIASTVKDNEYDFVIVDHIHRFSWGSDRRNLEDQLGQITNLSLDNNIPVLVLAQLRRFTRGEGQTYPRPILQDFRETEAFGQEASRAMAVWRKREGDGTIYASDGSSEIITLKDRHGALMSRPVWFDGKRQLFVPVPVSQSSPDETTPEEPPQEERHTIWS